MNEVQIDDQHRSLPSIWNELSRKQLIYVSRLFNGKLNLFEFRVKVLQEFLSVKRKTFRRIEPEDAYFLSETLDFLTKEVNLTRNVIPVIRTGLRKYYGPSDAMSNCTFGEFTLTSSVLDEYHKSGCEDHLDQLVAILYRPKKVFWFIRRHFTDHQDPRVRFMNRSLKRRAGRMAKVDHCIKHSVLLFFTGVLNSLPALYPYVYRQKDETDSQDNGWASLIISLADGKTDDKSLETIMNSNLYNVFIGLNKKAREYHEYLDKIESYGRH
ncbi:MAG: hypothetical protein EOM90_11400 [Alphaproteobacteria bacterium]|nr:hypothetical protein [Alphaproteobacteria bacterium]